MLQKPSQERYRWPIAIAYILAALVNSLPSQTFSSINVIVEDTFLISPIEVTLNALLFTFAHPVFAFPCNWLLSKYGLRRGYFVGAALVITGVWLRTFIQEGQATICLLGSGLAAVGNIFVVNTPSKIALSWFRKDIVPVFIFAGVLATLMSATLGASIPGFLLNNSSTQAEIKKFLLIEAAIVTFPYILLLIIFREKPNKPPSRAAEAVARQGPVDYKALMKKLFTNREYLKIIAGMSLSYGTFTSFIMVLDQTLKGLGYKNSGKITAYSILSAILIGVVANPIFSLILKKTKAYRAVGALSAAGVFVTLILLEFAYYKQVEGLASIMALAGGVGFFLLPLPSILITYASQQVFPIDESFSAGYLLAASQTFGFVVGIISISFLNSTPQRSKIVLSVFVGFILLSFFMILLTRQDLKKEKYQAECLENQTNSNLDQSLIIREPSDYQ